MEILDNISVNLSLDEIRRRLHMNRDSDFSAVKDLIDIARELIQPKALYNICYIEEKYEDAILVDAFRFKSQVLRKNLDQGQTNCLQK